MSLLCILQHLLQLPGALQFLHVIDGAEALSWAQTSTPCIYVTSACEGRCFWGCHLISSPVSQICKLTVISHFVFYSSSTFDEESGQRVPAVCGVQVVLDGGLLHAGQLIQLLKLELVPAILLVQIPLQVLARRAAALRV